MFDPPDSTIIDCSMSRLGEVYVAVAELCFCSMMVMVATASKIVLRGVASDKSSKATLQVGCDGW